MNRRDNRHIAATLVTLIFHGAIAVAMISIFLRYDASEQAERAWPPVDSSEILFGGEYVMTGDIAQTTPDDAPSAAETAPDESSSAEPDVAQEPAPEQHVTTTHDSPAKAVDSPKAPQQSKAEKEKEERRKAEEQRREREAAAINSRVSFGSGAGKSGQPDGNNATGAVSGVTADGLGNRQALSLPSPPKGPMGKITVTVKVDRHGNVTSATYLSGSGAAAANAKARNQCIAAARKARFSASSDAPPTQTGTLTYIYK